jgi:hypothetical protein
MRNKLRFRVPVFALFAFLWACGKPAPAEKPVVKVSKGDLILKDLGYNTRVDDATLAKMDAAFIRVPLEVKLGSLTDNDRALLRYEIMASQVIDRWFRKQVSGEAGLTLWNRFEELRKTDTLDGVDYHLWSLLKTYYGPWNHVEEDKPFIGSAIKPEGSTFYPPGMTKDMFKQYLDSHPDEKDKFLDPYTMVVERFNSEQGWNGYSAIPYNAAYPDEVWAAAGFLREAANFTTQPEVADFFTAAAHSFFTNDYRTRDVAWVKAMKSANNRFPFIIGPVEQYEDALFNVKAAAEAFILVRDDAETARLAQIMEFVPEMEEALPLPAELRHYRKAKDPILVVANELYGAGDANRGVKTAAFSLPNDEWVGENEGTVKVLIKNVTEAKFDELFMPLVSKVLYPGQARQVSKGIFITHIVVHEVGHKLGPGIVEHDGAEITVRECMGGLAGRIEEAKGDALGYWAIAFLAKKGYLSPDSLGIAAINSLPGVFRSIRFGLKEAHAKANLMLYSYLKSRGVYQHPELRGVDPYRVGEEQFYLAITDMVAEILHLYATCDQAGAQTFVDKYLVLPPEVQDMLAQFKDLPVDLRFDYVTADELMGGMFH